MFVGHYSASLLGKVAAPRVPIWVLLIAAQLVDVAWAVLVLLGVERMHLDPTLPSNPLVLEHMPYTHSLVASFAWAALAGVAVYVLLPAARSLLAAVVVGLVVVSHWALDVLVHRPDMTVWGSEPRLGLALWNSPLLAYGLEVALLAGAAGLLAARRTDAAARRALVRGVGVLVVLQTATTLGPVPPSATALLLSVLVTFLVVAWAGARLERRLA